jgi:PAS domain S-box-containing protein
MNRSKIVRGNDVQYFADQTARILVVDDEPAHAEAVARAIRDKTNFAIEIADTLTAYHSAIAIQRPDLALVDLNLPDGSAFQLLTSPIEQCSFPIVVMTSHGNEATAVEAMKAGAFDYVVKSAEAFAEMPHTIERALRGWKLLQERMRAEQALRESEERHRTLFQKSRDALMTLAPPAWRFTSGNAAAIALFGARDEEDFVSHAPWQYSPDLQPDGHPSLDKAKEQIDCAMREGSLSFEWVHRRVSGEEFPATVLHTRLEINGEAMLQGTVRDESEKRRLQASVAQSDRLASMGLLAAGVAHEINNPLVYVRFNLESLVQDLPRLAEAVQRSCSSLQAQVGEVAYRRVVGDAAESLTPAAFADAIERAREALEGVERIVAITRGLSTFSRVERTKRARVDVNGALQAAIAMTHNELQHRAQLVTDLGPTPAVWANEGKLSQVFLNLLVNACHAIDEGAARKNQITVRSWTEPRGIFVEIVDTGKGIAPENLERIFEPFFTTKPVGVGSGLGLSICRNLLTEVKGSLSVQSEVGTGTRFLVHLPAAEDAQREPPEDSVPDKPKALKMHGRILIIEDEEVIRKSLVRLLERDHEVLTAASGAEGQVLITADQEFDLILCDVMMPHMSGVELHAWLALNFPRLAAQTVFITGGAFTPRTTAYLAQVGNLTLEKPFNFAALKQQVFERVALVKVAT